MNLVHKRFKMGLEILSTLSILFRPQSIVHALSGINMARHGESKRNGIGFVCSSDSKPKMLLIWQWHHIGWPYVAMHR